MKKPEIKACIMLNLAAVVAPAGFTASERMNREMVFAVMMERQAIREVSAVIAGLIYALPEDDAYFEAHGCQFWPSQNLSLQMTGFTEQAEEYLHPIFPLPASVACELEWQPGAILKSLMAVLDEAHALARGDVALALITALAFRHFAYGTPAHHLLELTERILGGQHRNDDRILTAAKSYRPHAGLVHLVNTAEGRHAPRDEAVAVLRDFDRHREIPF